MPLICPCGSAETSTGLGDTITCFQCGRHGDHKHVGKPSPSGDEPVAVVEEDDADDSDDAGKGDQ